MIEAREVMAEWNKPRAVKNFCGATLGYFESTNINTGEMAIIEAIVDFTHRRFCYIPYRGSKAQTMKEAIDKALPAPDTSSFSVLWTWAEDNQVSHKNLLYHTTLLSNSALFLSLCKLWEMCLEYGETYKDKVQPKLPKPWKSRLKFLEEECKLAIKWQGLKIV